MEEEIYERIDRYWQNEMTAEERAGFEAEMQRDAALAETVRLYRDTQTQLQHRIRGKSREQDFRALVADIIQTESNTTARVVPLYQRWYTWAAAACVALLCVALLYQTGGHPEYADFATPEQMSAMQRGTGQATWQQAETAFNQRDYQQASLALAELLQQDPNNPDLLYYQGIALTEINQLDEARRLLTQLHDHTKLYRSAAAWRLALVALKAKDDETCKQWLQEIPEGADEYANARKLLYQL